MGDHSKKSFVPPRKEIMYENMAILTAFILLYNIPSKELEKPPINGAVIFIAAGLILGHAVLGILTDVVANMPFSFKHGDCS